MFGIGTVELCVIGGIAVMLFGSNLPRVARSVGQSVMEFKRGFLEVSAECQKIEEGIDA